MFTLEQNNGIPNFSLLYGLIVSNITYPMNLTNNVCTMNYLVPNCVILEVIVDGRRLSQTQVDNTPDFVFQLH